MKITYYSVRKSFQIPKENIEPLLKDLEAKLKQESERVGSFAYLRPAEQGSKIAIKAERMDYPGALTIVEYGSLNIGKEGARVTLNKIKDLVIRPWEVEDVLKKYGKRIE